MIRLVELPRGQQRRPVNRDAVTAERLGVGEVVVGGASGAREGERSLAGAY